MILYERCVRCTQPCRRRDYCRFELGWKWHAKCFLEYLAEFNAILDGEVDP